MCGIAGILNVAERHEPPSLELLTAMVSAIRYRGPDEYGVYRDRRAGLVHARLSLIDLASGQQPLANEDGTLWIVFNGEIFNYIELRKELLALGHRFRTQSDTEVIVHAWEAWGNDAFRRFNGQWALALWDTRKGTLVLSRDRIGVRPLFVCAREGRIRFASEVKALFADPAVPREIDPRGMDQTFTYWTSVAPVSLFRGIEELRPGSVRTYAADGTSEEMIYWTPSYPARTQRYPLTFGEATEALAEKLETATRLRILRADVPVGSYLSGGLDSSVTAWMGRKAKEGVFRTYSMRFEDAEYDETEYQRAMAATIDSSHQELVVRRGDIARVFPDVIHHTERPVLRTAPAPLYLLSKLVRDSGIKAVLTGEGADEMLAGYDIFREAEIRRFWSREPGSTARPALFNRLYPYLARSPQQTKGMALQFWRQGLERAGEPGFSHEPRWRTTSQVKRFFTRAFQAEIAAAPAPDVLEGLPADFGAWDSLSQAQYLEVVTLLSGYLISSQGDRMLMAHSVEGRFPFLDADVMEFCNGLPPEYKLAGLNEKFILKRVAAGHIPETIIRRPKQPYRAPDAASFTGPDAPSYVAGLLSESAVREAGIFEPSAVQALYSKCAAQGAAGGVFSNADNMSFVGILSTQLVYHDLVRRRDPSPDGRITYTTRVDRVVPQQHPETA